MVPVLGLGAKIRECPTGVHRGAALLPDDRTAASLVRPLPGSLEATGNISGALTLDGAPAPFVVVDVLRSDGRRARPAASVFSNRRGAFHAEGLPPGEYFLWIHPLKNAFANPDLAERGAGRDRGPGHPPADPGARR